MTTLNVESERIEAVGLLQGCCGFSNRPCLDGLTIMRRGLVALFMLLSSLVAVRHSLRAEATVAYAASISAEVAQQSATSRPAQVEGNAPMLGRSAARLPSGELFDQSPAMAARTYIGSDRARE